MYISLYMQFMRTVWVLDKAAHEKHTCNRSDMCAFASFWDRYLAEVLVTWYSGVQNCSTTGHLPAYKTNI